MEVAEEEIDDDRVEQWEPSKDDIDAEIQMKIMKKINGETGENGKGENKDGFFKRLFKKIFFFLY